MKKICFVATIAASLRTFLLSTAKSLHETNVFSIYFMASPDAEIEKEFPEFIHFIPMKMKRGIGFDGIKVISKMERVFKREKFDIVQYFTPNASCYASIAAKMAHIPNRIYSQWGIVYVGFSGLKRRVFKALEKKVCKYSTVIEVENRANLVFSHQEGLYPESKGSVIWNGSACGVSLSKYDVSKKNEYSSQVRCQYHISEEAFVFGFVGRVTKDKGFNELLRAFRKVCDLNLDIHLLVVGSTSAGNIKGLDQDLYQWAQNNKKVHFIGRTPFPERYYSAMDCYVMPSYREGFGMTIIEAESMGTPVIVSKIAGHEDTMIPGETGLYFDSHSSDSVYEAMLNMISNRELCKKMGENGREYVRDHFEQNELMNRIVSARLEMVENQTN